MKTRGFELVATPAVVGSKVLLDGKELEGVTRVLIDCDARQGRTEVRVYYIAKPIRAAGEASVVELVDARDACSPLRLDVTSLPDI